MYVRQSDDINIGGVNLTVFSSTNVSICSGEIVVVKNSRGVIDIGK